MKITFLLFLLFGVLGDSFAQSDVILPGGVKNGNGATSGQVLKWNGSAWVPGADDSGAADGNGIISALPVGNVNITSGGFDLTFRGISDVKARYDTLGSAFSNAVATELIATNSAGPGNTHRFKTSVVSSPTEGSGFKESIEGRTFIDWKNPGTSGYLNSFSTSLYSSSTASSVRGLHMFKGGGTNWDIPNKVVAGSDLGYISWASTDTTALIGTAPTKFTNALTSPSSGISGFVYRTFNYQKFYGGLKFWTTEGNRTLIAALQLDTLTKSILPVDITATRIGTAALRINSTTGGLVPPRMTTTQRDALTNLTASTIIWNTTLSTHQFWTGSSWSSLPDNWGTQTVVSSSRFSGNGTAGSPLELAQQSASTGQVLAWNGSTWSPANQTTGISTVGAFQTTNTSAGLSISGTDIRLHHATLLTAGGISLSDQFIGKGTKTFTKDAAGIAIPIVSQNSAASFDDDAVAFHHVLGSTVASVLKTTIVGGSVSGGTVTTLSNMDADGTIRNAFEITPKNSFKTIGFINRRIQNVGASFSAVAITNRASAYNFQTAAGALTLPDPTTLDEGEEVEWKVTFTTGSDATINTAAAGSEFWANGSGAAIASISLTAGVKSGKLVVTSIGGTNYWLNSVYN
jgi:hypothetical protein